MLHNRINTRGIVAVRANATPANILANLNKDWETFKSEYESDKAKIKGLQDQLDAMAMSSAAMQINGGTTPLDDKGLTNEYGALAHFSQTGQVRADLSIGDGSDSSKGGYAVFPKVSDKIYVRMFDQSAMARLARTVQMDSGSNFEEPQDLGQPDAEWVGETQARPKLDTAVLDMLDVRLDELYTNQQITQRLLDDSDYNLGAWLTERISDKFSRSSGDAFLNGDGVLKPRGLTTYTLDAATDDTRAWGTIQALYTGADGAIGATPDILVDTVYALRSMYRRNARWIMNSNTAGAIRKMKDADGRFLWTESLSEGQPPMLLGYPVEMDEYMPDMGTDSVSVMFGDFAQAYCIVRRPGLRMLRDPYTAKPNVQFYAYTRVGGALQNSDAVKALVFGSAA